MGWLSLIDPIAHPPVEMIWCSCRMKAISQNPIGILFDNIGLIIGIEKRWGDRCVSHFSSGEKVSLIQQDWCGGGRNHDIALERT